MLKLLYFKPYVQQSVIDFTINYMLQQVDTSIHIAKTAQHIFWDLVTLIMYNYAFFVLDEYIFATVEKS